MKVTCCDLCGQVYKPDDSEFRPFAGTTQTTTLRRESGAINNSNVPSKSIEFEVRIDIKPTFSPKGRHSTEVDVCPRCLWSAIESIKTHGLPTIDERD